MIRLIVVGSQNKDLIDFETKIIKRIKKLYNQFELIEMKQSDSKKESLALAELINKINEKHDCKNIFLEIKADALDIKSLKNLIIDDTINKFQINFIIGGAEGFDNIYSKLEKCVKYEKKSLSKLTFTHQLCKLFLIEQVYRILTIEKNIPYHK